MSSQLKNSFDSTQVDPSINVRSYESVSKLGAAQILANNVTINQPKANDVAIIMYTSGSTGKPKGKFLLQCLFVLQDGQDIGLDISLNICLFLRCDAKPL